MEKKIDFELFKKLLELEHQKYVPTNDIEGFNKYETYINNFTNELKRYLSGKGFVVEYGCGIGKVTFFIPDGLRKYIDELQLFPSNANNVIYHTHFSNAISNEEITRIRQYCISILKN